MNIHLVEPWNHFVKLKDNVWESVGWEVEESKAQKLVGGEIFFHKNRQEPSFYGGTIIGYRVIQGDGCPGQIAFKLHYNPLCRDVRTDKTGWKKAVKITDDDGHHREKQ